MALQITALLQQEVCDSCVVADACMYMCMHVEAENIM